MLDWDGDGVDDVLLGTFQGELLYFKNVGSRSFPQFAEGSLVVLGPTITTAGGGSGSGTGGSLRPWATDWDNDRLIDQLIANGEGFVLLYLNGGTKTDPKFASELRLTANERPLSLGQYVSAYGADWNEDGATDLLGGASFTSLYLNEGSSADPHFTSGAYMFSTRGAIVGDGPKAVDWDGGGNRDLVTLWSGELYVYFNRGSNSAVFFCEPTIVMVAEDEPLFPPYEIADWNEDCCQSAKVGRLGTREGCYCEEPGMSSLRDLL